MPTISGPPPPRLHAGVDPRLLHAHRRGEEGERHRRRAARAQRARGSEPARAARDGRAAAAEGRDHELSGGADRGGRRHQQPGGSVGRHAQGAVLARALHRARRLPRGSAEEVLPPGARARGAAALRVLHHVHGGREGRRRRDRRAALHLRSGHARRRRARRPPGEGDAALGVGGARGRRRGAAVRPALLGRPIPRTCPTDRIVPRSPQPALARGRHAAAGPSRASPRRRPARGSSSSASATSRSIRTRGPARSCSTARCRCATRGRGSNREARSRQRRREHSPQRHRAQSHPVGTTEAQRHREKQNKKDLGVSVSPWLFFSARFASPRRHSLALTFISSRAARFTPRARSACGCRPVFLAGRAATSSI